MDELLGSMEALSVTLDERDAYTYGHCERVVRLASALGVACGLRSEDLEILEIAAAFHDIGKIGVRDAVLLKPTHLDADEWEQMKSHSVRGERIFRAADLEYGDSVAPIIRHHHESVDGSGYPDGLRGDAIPLACRVLLVVDAYDAMTTTRPYQRARNHAEVMDILAGEQGTKLDPDIFTVFERIIDHHPLRAH